MNPDDPLDEMRRLAFADIARDPVLCHGMIEALREAGILSRATADLAIRAAKLLLSPQSTA